MPSTKIETRKGWLGQRRPEVMQAVQRALQDALRIPDWDRCIRVLEHDQDAFLAPPGKGLTYTLIELRFSRDARLTRSDGCTALSWRS